MMEKKKRWVREVIGNYMVDLAAQDEKVVAVSADLFRSCRMEKFMERCPDRMYNTGIAEQNMVGFAAGLCREGFKPYAFSMASFVSMRACEQCRTDIAYANANAVLVGVYSGVSGGLSGATHWSIEDCAIMTSFPNMTVLEPSDGVQAQKMLKATLDWNGPVYIRVSVVPSVDIYPEDYDYQIGKASVARGGNDGAILCSGVLVQYALEAAEEIQKETGKCVRVVDMHTIKPVDRQAIRDAAATGCVLAAQDHNIIGGLGYQAAAVIAEEGLQTKFKIAGIQDRFVPMARPDYLYAMFEIDKNGLKKQMLAMMEDANHV
ncbi:MAG: transketolase family protein [Faecousia sp.]